MSGPWEDYAPAETKPWEDFAKAQPAQKMLVEKVASDRTDPVRGIAEGIGTLATNTAATVASGYAGLAGAVLPGPEGQGAAWVKKVQEAVPQPETGIGKAISAAASWPGEQLAKVADTAGDKVADVTGSAAAGAAVNTAIQAAPLAISKIASKMAPGGETYSSFAKRREDMVRNMQRDEALTNARDAGYVVPPTQGSPSIVNKALEGFGGKIKTAQAMSEKNQPITNRLIREEFGLTADAPLNAETMNGIRRNAGMAYERIRNTGTVTADMDMVNDLSRISAPYENAWRNFPKDSPSPVIGEVANALEPSFDAGAAVDKIRLLREKADSAFSGAKPDKSLGRAYKGIADAIESQLERHLETVPGISPDVLTDFRDARATIAKTYTVERALRGTTGNVDAKRMATRLNKDPLTGNLRTVAEFGEAFPKAAQVPERVGGVPMSPLDWGFALGKTFGPAMAGAGAGYASGHPALSLVGLAPFLRPGIRNMLASDIYQNAMVRPPSYGPGFANSLLAAQENPITPLVEMSQGQR